MVTKRFKRWQTIFTSRMLDYMCEHDLSYQKLADILGVSYKTISDWLNGNHSPRLETIFEMEEKLGIKLIEF